jgi:hypothetical protein
MRINGVATRLATVVGRSEMSWTEYRFAKMLTTTRLWDTLIAYSSAAAVISRSIFDSSQRVSVLSYLPQHSLSLPILLMSTHCNLRLNKGPLKHTDHETKTLMPKTSDLRLSASSLRFFLGCQLAYLFWLCFGFCRDVGRNHPSRLDRRDARERVRAVPGFRSSRPASPLLPSCLVLVPSTTGFDYVFFSVSDVGGRPTVSLTGWDQSQRTSDIPFAGASHLAAGSRCPCRVLWLLGAVFLSGGGFPTSPGDVWTWRTSLLAGSGYIAKEEASVALDR